MDLGTCNCHLYFFKSVGHILLRCDFVVVGMLIGVRCNWFIMFFCCLIDFLFCWFVQSCVLVVRSHPACRCFFGVAVVVAESVVVSVGDGFWFTTIGNCIPLAFILLSVSSSP